MGISGLLPCLRSIEEMCNLEQFRGKTIGVDTYCWLHRLCKGSAMELTTGGETLDYLKALVRRVDLFTRMGIRLVMVFDGADMPLKRETNVSRRAKRVAARTRANVLSTQGREKEARTEYMTSLDITHEIAHSLIRVLREKKIECITAPYEADAQLAYLARTNYIDVVVTEDSDLLAYLTPRVIYKLDHKGSGVLIDSSKLANTREIQLRNFDADMMLTNFIMAGCDYTPSLHGVGIKKANKLVGEHKSIGRILTVLRTDTKYSSLHMKNLHEYEHAFLKAFFAFKHHIVYDPIEKKTRYFNVLSENVMQIEEGWLESVLGEITSPEISEQICGECSIHPVDKTPWNEDDPALKNASRYIDQLRGTQIRLTRLSGSGGSPLVSPTCTNFNPPRVRKSSTTDQDAVPKSSFTQVAVTSSFYEEDLSPPDAVEMLNCAAQTIDDLLDTESEDINKCPHKKCGVAHSIFETSCLLEESNTSRKRSSPDVSQNSPIQPLSRHCPNTDRRVVSESSNESPKILNLYSAGRKRIFRSSLVGSGYTPPVLSTTVSSTALDVLVKTPLQMNK